MSSLFSTLLLYQAFICVNRYLMLRIVVSKVILVPKANSHCCLNKTLTRGLFSLLPLSLFDYSGHASAFLARYGKRIPGSQGKRLSHKVHVTKGKSTPSCTGESLSPVQWRLGVVKVSGLRCPLFCTVGSLDFWL